MLVVSRKEGQRIYIGDDIVITILGAQGPVSIGIAAPRDIRIIRSELEPIAGFPAAGESYPPLPRKAENNASQHPAHQRSARPSLEGRRRDDLSGGRR